VLKDPVPDLCGSTQVARSDVGQSKSMVASGCDELAVVHRVLK